MKIELKDVLVGKAIAGHLHGTLLTHTNAVAITFSPHQDLIAIGKHIEIGRFKAPVLSDLRHPNGILIQDEVFFSAHLFNINNLFRDTVHRFHAIFQKVGFPGIKGYRVAPFGLCLMQGVGVHHRL